MDIKEYLLTQDDLNLTKFAKRMWPNNKSAKSYLSMKLRGLDGRSFTEKDATLAHQALKQLTSELKKIS